jgi:hypothetical protein
MSKHMKSSRQGMHMPRKQDCPPQSARDWQDPAPPGLPVGGVVQRPDSHVRPAPHCAVLVHAAQRPWVALQTMP